MCDGQFLLILLWPRGFTLARWMGWTSQHIDILQLLFPSITLPDLRHDGLHANQKLSLPRKIYRIFNLVSACSVRSRLHKRSEVSSWILIVPGKLCLLLMPSAVTFSHLLGVKIGSKCYVLAARGGCVRLFTILNITVYRSKVVKAGAISVLPRFIDDHGPQTCCSVQLESLINISSILDISLV